MRIGFKTDLRSFRCLRGSVDDLPVIHVRPSNRPRRPGIGSDRARYFMNI